MNFSLGFYRTRDGSIVELTDFKEKTYVGRAVVSSRVNLNRSLYWNNIGDACYYVTPLDLTEFLKVKENNSHDGPPLRSLIQEIFGDSETRK